ncbi:hypothetical protein DTO271G3_3508 [Paecilomyces variotii]|nr:hypothetical protein DTO271G3_3508 [Paecilomyces variotii]
MGVSSFQVNCPLPDKITNYVSGPNTRGTLDILWSSVSVLLLCTWSIQHLNVPPQFCAVSRKTSKRQWWRFRPTNYQEQSRRAYLFCRKLKWLMINIIMPELVLGLALSEWISAREYWPVFERWANDDGIEWSLGHTYFANMGGFIIRFSEESDDTHCLSGRAGNGMNGTLQPENEMLTSSQDVEAGLHSTCQGDPETSLETLQNQSKGTVMRQVSSQTSPPPDPASLESVSCNVDGNTAATASPSTQDVKTVRPQSENMSMRSKLDYRIAADIGRYENHPSVGSSKYAKRLLAWNNYFGFDWQINVHNQKVVQHAMQSCRVDDLGESPVLRWYFNIRMLQGNVWYLDAPQLLLAREMGLIRKLPNLPISQLEDQSNGAVNHTNTGLMARCRDDSSARPGTTGCSTGSRRASLFCLLLIHLSSLLAQATGRTESDRDHGFSTTRGFRRQIPGCSGT